MFKNGDHHTFGELYDRHYPLIYNRCLQLCKDEDAAFDLTQEIMLKAFDHLDDFRGDSQFKTWIFTIATRHCYSFLHKKTPSLVVSDQLADNLADDTDSDQQNIMLALINRLPQEERTLLLRKYEAGVSIEDLQKELNLSASAIKMRLKRSREKLNVLYSLALISGIDYALNMFEMM